MHLDTVKSNFSRNCNGSTLEWGIRGNRHEVEKHHQSKKSPSLSANNFLKFSDKKVSRNSPSPFKTVNIPQMKPSPTSILCNRTLK